VSTARIAVTTASSLRSVWGPRLLGGEGFGGRAPAAYTLERATCQTCAIMVSGYRRPVAGLTVRLIAGTSSTRPRAPFFR
jgi:hypothetical protein